MSGDSVAKMMQSMSFASIFASSIARLAAWRPRSLQAVLPSGSTYLRASMPVRALIHSSFVCVCSSAQRACWSFRKRISSLVTTRSGT